MGTLNQLFEAKNENHKMALKDKLHKVKMQKDEGVATYFTRVAQVKDELAAIGDIIPYFELVRIALKGFTKKWEVFVKCIVSREKLPNWFRLWDYFTQEEIRKESLGSQFNEEVENNLALETKLNKNNKDISQVRCYQCGHMGNYALKCHEKKNVKENTERDMAGYTTVQDYTVKFE